MDTQSTVFSQVVNQVHREVFRRCVDRYRGENRVRSFSCRDQFLAMVFAQLTFRESLRDLESCLRARTASLYQAGFRSKVLRSTLADANAIRDWRIWSDLAQKLIAKAKALYAGGDIGLQLRETVYALDSTTIDLCLKLFPWAHFRSTKAGIKLHTLLDLRGPIPSFIEITPAKVHDIRVLDTLIAEPGSFYIMDRAYLDFQRLFTLSTFGAYFVVRSRRKLDFIRHHSQPVPSQDQDTVRSDQIGVLRNFYPRKKYPDKLRRVHVYDEEHDQRLILLTNHFELPAVIVGELYRQRWQVELFFKWIKQNLRIKRFFGNSENAVRTQIWIAITVYVMVAIIRKQLDLPQSLHRILQVLSVSVFEKIPLNELLTQSDHSPNTVDNSNQLMLFDF